MYWLIAAIVLLLATVVLFYNRLIRARNRVRTAWSDIDVQLQRRYDLVPQLVKAVDQYARYEKATLEAVSELRAKAMRLTEVAARGDAEEQLGKGITRLIALAENYPDLKANESFLHLQTELVETEDFLQYARRYYNGAVRDYNTMVESVPSNFVAAAFRFRPRAFFQKASDDAADVPKVELGSAE